MIENPKNPILSLDVQKMQTWVAPAKTMYQGDQGYVQPFRLTNSWENYDVKADNLCFSATKPDGGIIEIENEPDRFVKKDGVWFFKLPDQITQAIGAVNCFFYVKDTSQNIIASTTKFTYRVEAKFTDAENHNSYISSIKKLEDIFYEYIQTAKTMVNGLDFELNKELNKIQEDWQTQKNELSDNVNAYRDNLYESLDGVNEKINNIEITTISEINNQLKDAREKLNDLLEKIKDINFNDYAQKTDLKPFVKTVQGIKPDDQGNVNLEIKQGIDAKQLPAIKIKKMTADNEVVENTQKPTKQDDDSFLIDLTENSVIPKVKELVDATEEVKEKVEQNSSELISLKSSVNELKENSGNTNSSSTSLWCGTRDEYEKLKDKSDTIIYLIQDVEMSDQ